MSTPSSVRLVSMVAVTTTRGSGAPDDPQRAVQQYWSHDGRLAAEVDLGGLDIPIDMIGAELARLSHENRLLTAKVAQLESARRERAGEATCTHHLDGGASSAVRCGAPTSEDSQL